jgi:hypothetical protein
VARVKYGDSWYDLNADLEFLARRVPSLAEQGKVDWFQGRTTDEPRRDVSFLLGAGVPLVITEE